ncbi:MAG: nickel-dependent hydrogenase large subunit [Armatimonadota bacterium]|nr:nickel-dependent hydrogenase large subunit [Armatimonadota bacterium]MDR7486283.1 nickel-dependent hydrogenase large subunit [Armatimonadota bacterium]
MPRVVIDPITRIEGHLRIEAQVESGRVTDAWSSSTMFRGMELILKGRDPRDAWLFAQRICGVCTTVHALCAVRAVENALNIEIPDNARIIRNIIAGIQYVQDHVIHFYHLHALDWVDLMAALQADPAETSRLAQSLSPWPKASTTYFTAVQDRLRRFAASGQLGLFANAYWGHPAYRLPPAANLMAVAHYLEALDWQSEVIKIHAILGSKNPHPQTYLVGGMAIPLDPHSPTALNADRLQLQRQLLVASRDFVDQVYLPDVVAIAGAYKEWTRIGTGVGTYLSYGDFPTDTSGDPARLWLPRGVILDRDLSRVHPMDQQQITEFVTHSWYRYGEGDQAARHPWEGETVPAYTGPAPPYRFLDTDGKYSWIKAPRYDNRPMEVGPLARMLVAYAAGHRQVRTAVDRLLAALGAGPEALFSTLGRVAARAIETQLVAHELLVWHDQLVANIARGDLRIHNGQRWDPSTWPREAGGWGFHEAPRGALGHWVRIRDGAIANYQTVVPSTWNGSPRDARGQRGPYEVALVGTPVADPARPVEILRTVHSFDPCMACAVHVVGPSREPLARIRIV